jgi:3-methyladenine DNA glycosylase/8-oxoguanine DNA glycosylase
MEITIATPPTFSFKRTVLSHGWCQLPPFDLNENDWTLTRVIDLGEARPVTVTLAEAAAGFTVTTRQKLGRAAAAKVERDVRHMLRLDDDMTAFYQSMSAEPDFAWIASAGAGRMLRAPTVFEDLVKTICTTNCSWALTDKMVRELVGGLGREARDGRRAFPTPEAMAEAPESFYREVVRAGYRATYLKELAGRVASGELDVERWLASDLPTAELVREMKRVKGVGTYAAENLLKLVGRYDGLALDSWVRGKFARTHNKGRPAADKKIERYYARFGAWRGLALWCDMTRDWIGEEQAVKW